jgi:hypothetical protein
MPKDSLRRLPDNVTAALLRALITLPAPRNNRLVLQRADDDRPPGYDKTNDYNVMFQGRQIGRICATTTQARPAAPWLNICGTGIGATRRAEPIPAATLIRWKPPWPTSAELGTLHRKAARL